MPLERRALDLFCAPSSLIMESPSTSAVTSHPASPLASVLSSHPAPPRPQVNSIVGLLADEADPMVSVMKVDKAPTESYADIGTCASPHPSLLLSSTPCVWTRRAPRRLDDQ